MLRTILTFGLIFLCFGFCFAQNSESDKKIIFKADTEFSAEIENAINAETNKIGEDVNFKLTEDFKGEGETILKGSELYGRIVDIQKPSAANKETALVSVIFDYVKKDGDFLSLTAKIISIDKNAEKIECKPAQGYYGGTTLSIKGKKLVIDKGAVFRIKLVKNITEN